MGGSFLPTFVELTYLLCTSFVAVSVKATILLLILLLLLLVVVVVVVVVFGSCGAFGKVLHEESIRCGTEDGVRSVLWFGSIGTVRVVPTVTDVVAGTMFDTEGSGCDGRAGGYDVVTIAAAVDGAGTQHRTVSK